MFHAYFLVELSVVTHVYISGRAGRWTTWPILELLFFVGFESPIAHRGNLIFSAQPCSVHLVDVSYIRKVSYSTVGRLGKNSLIKQKIEGCWHSAAHTCELRS